MWKVVKYVIELNNQLHKYIKLYTEQKQKAERYYEMYNALYFQIQNILGENNETLVAHYDGTNIPEYTIEEIKNYKEVDKNEDTN